MHRVQQERDKIPVIEYFVGNLTKFVHARLRKILKYNYNKGYSRKAY